MIKDFFIYFLIAITMCMIGGIAIFCWIGPALLGYYFGFGWYALYIFTFPLFFTLCFFVGVKGDDIFK